VVGNQLNACRILNQAKQNIKMFSLIVLILLCLTTFYIGLGKYETFQLSTIYSF